MGEKEKRKRKGREERRKKKRKRKPPLKYLIVLNLFAYEVVQVELEPYNGIPE